MSCQAAPVVVCWVGLVVEYAGESLLVMINDVTHGVEQLSLFCSIFSWVRDCAVDLQHFSEDLGLPERNRV